MTDKQFFDWQTEGGANDVLRLVDCLERAGVNWCAIGGIAVNHWAEEPMVTRDVDFAVGAGEGERAIAALTDAGFAAERFAWSVNFKGDSKLSLQMSTDGIYPAFPERSVAAEVHGIPLRVASLADTLSGKILAWRDSDRRQSKRLKDFADIVRLVEAHPHLRQSLPEEIRLQVEPPPGGR